MSRNKLNNNGKQLVRGKYILLLLSVLSFNSISTDFIDNHYHGSKYIPLPQRKAAIQAIQDVGNLWFTTINLKYYIDKAHTKHTRNQPGSVSDDLDEEQDSRLLTKHLIDII